MNCRLNFVGFLLLVLTSGGMAGAQLRYDRADDALAQTAPSGGDSADAAAPRGQLAEPREAPPSAQEQEALALARQWMEARDHPVLSENGQVRFLFGAALPVIVCAPLRGTDIALQPGEVVKPDGVHTGDAVRWQIMPAVSGPTGNETTHLIVKPTDVGLSTNMIVGTDRRTYHFELVSRKDDWMPSVGFNYPEELESEWSEYQKNARTIQVQNTIADTGESIPALDFSYRIEGAAPWKPLRVYNNGSKTIVQMPGAMKSGEAPALLVLGEAGKEQVVNYRVLGDRYIVDMVFEQAVLILGVGRKQTRVTIAHLH